MSEDLKINSKSFKQWMKYNFNKDELGDMINHGVDGGFHGMIYYADLDKLFMKFKDELIDMLDDTADEQGYNGFMDMFVQNGTAKKIRSYNMFISYVVWCCAELIAYEMIEESD